MKQKIIDYLKANKGEIVLCLITLILTLITGAIAALFGASGKAIVGGCFGSLALIAVNSVGDNVGMSFSRNSRPGIVGIILGILILLAF